VQVVADHDHAEGLLAQAPDQIQHLACLCHAERRGGLVQQYEARRAHHRACDRDRLALAAGQRRDRRAHARNADRQAPQQLGRVPLHGGLVEPAGARRELAAEEQVADHVQVVAQGKVLVDGRDAERGRAAWSVERRIVPFEADLPVVDRQDARDDLDQRGLAGTVVADQRHDLARVRLEIDLAQRLHRAEALADAA
jgi:hypothetical protein